MTIIFAYNFVAHPPPLAKATAITLR
jgi:hypothetical protein